MEIISRKEAKRKGFKFYYTGVSCKHGHICERYTISCSCYECSKKYQKENYSAYYQKNKQRLRENRKEWYENNPNYSKEWRDANRDHVNELARERDRIRYKNDIDFRMRKISRSMLGRVIKRLGGKKSGSTQKELGYSADQLKNHLENLFLEGMSWGNYGDWEIDHKTPVTRCYEYGIMEISEVNALENLIPMWKEDNYKKSDRTLDEFLSEFPEYYEKYSKFI